MDVTIGPIECVAATRAALGEGPLWDVARQCLWFVDITGRNLHRFDPADRTVETHAAPAEIGWVLPAQDGRLLAGLRDGLYWFDPQRRRFAFRQAVPGEPAGNRLNDACTDREGRVWFGSMSHDGTAATGRFYCLEAGRIRPAGPAGIAITNGPAVSGDGRTIYFTDTLGGRIVKARLDADGTLGPVGAFATLDAADGLVDGPVVDAEDCLWTGLYGGWSIQRFAPDGRHLTSIPLPVANVTKLAFGGPDLRTIYVTSATKCLAAPELVAQPLAGGLFACRSSVAGIAPTPVGLIA
jgi:xylono-1,5-lactonase